MSGRHSFVLILAAGALLALSACVSPTVYQPATDNEGYTDQQIADDKYRVTFFGNSVTPRNVVDNDLLYRAAELTVSTGNDYFLLLSHDVERDVTYLNYVDVPYPYWGPFYDPFFYDGYTEVTSQPIEKYRAYATIAVGKGEPPKDNPNAYDARDVMKRLSGSVLRPAPRARRERRLRRLIRCNLSPLPIVGGGGAGHMSVGLRPGGRAGPRRRSPAIGAANAG